MKHNETKQPHSDSIVLRAVAIFAMVFQFYDLCGIFDPQKKPLPSLPTLRLCLAYRVFLFFFFFFFLKKKLLCLLSTMWVLHPVRYEPMVSRVDRLVVSLLAPFAPLLENVILPYIFF